MNGMPLRIIVLLATIAVISINYLAAVGKIGGITPDRVSAMYPTVVTPAGYAFSIWSLIYIGIIAFSIWQLRSHDERLHKARLFYLASSAANIGWIFCWHYQLIPLSLLLIATLTATLFAASKEFASVRSTGDLWCARVPLFLYFGWVTAATFVNAAVVLSYFNVNFSPLMAQAIGSTLIIAVTAIGAFVRFKYDTMVYPLAISWATAAIGVGQSGKTFIVIFSAISMMALIFVALWGYVKDR
ncbi:MAG: tryptophan-rich sensory protein [Pyrinomonadaceae bacterium]